MKPSERIVEIRQQISEARLEQSIQAHGSSAEFLMRVSGATRESMLAVLNADPSILAAAIIVYLDERHEADSGK